VKKGRYLGEKLGSIPARDPSLRWDDAEHFVQNYSNFRQIQTINKTKNPFTLIQIRINGFRVVFLINN
jgi:hypothetical protein